jgi:FkbM family methyltransferase
MLKDFYRKIFIFLTDKLVRKNNQIKNHIAHQKTEKEWDRHFKGSDQILYELPGGLKIKLYRQSKLTEYILFHEFEKAELCFFESYLQRNDVVLDIGANIGFHTIHAGKLVGEEGRVFAFEPVLNSFAHLMENIALNKSYNVIAANIGFSDKNEAATINVSENYNAWNTLAKKDKMEANEAAKFNTTETIQLQRLDDWISLNINNPEDISLVKIDVEGWEKYVILGGIHYFEINAPVVMMEFSDVNTFAAGYQCLELYEMFASFGYVWYRFDMNERKLKPFPKQFTYYSENLIAVKPGSKGFERLVTML